MKSGGSRGERGARGGNSGLSTKLGWKKRRCGYVPLGTFLIGHGYPLSVPSAGAGADVGVSSLRRIGRRCRGHGRAHARDLSSVEQGTRCLDDCHRAGYLTAGFDCHQQWEELERCFHLLQRRYTAEGSGRTELRTKSELAIDSSWMARSATQGLPGQSATVMMDGILVFEEASPKLLITTGPIMDERRRNDEKKDHPRGISRCESDMPELEASITDFLWINKKRKSFFQLIKKTKFNKTGIILADKFKLYTQLITA